MLINCTVRSTNPDQQIPVAARELLINSELVAYWQPTPEGHARAHFPNGVSILLEEAFTDVYELLMGQQPVGEIPNPGTNEWADRPGLATLISDVQRSFRRER